MTQAVASRLNFCDIKMDLITNKQTYATGGHTQDRQAFANTWFQNTTKITQHLAQITARGGQRQLGPKQIGNSIALMHYIALNRQ